MVQPHFSFDNAPDFDILIVSGRYGAEEIEINNEIVIQWIKRKYYVSGFLLLRESP